MDPSKFYNNLWRVKRTSNSESKKERDRFHRFVLDPIFDPYANPRSEIALRMLSGGQRLLDIGCWDGGFLALVKETGLFDELHGIDVVQEGIELACKNGFIAKVVDINIDPLPYQDEYFDEVTILAVLEHVFDPHSIIRETWRVLTLGGGLIIAVPNVGSFTNRIRLLFGRIPVTSHDPGWDGGHLHYFTKHALDDFLEDEGFEILKKKTSGGRPMIREWFLSLFAGELIYSCRKK